MVEGISFFEVYFIIQEYNLYRIRTSEAKVKLHAQEFISIAKIITIYHITKHALQFLVQQRNWWDYSEKLAILSSAHRLHRLLRKTLQLCARMINLGLHR